MLREIKILHKNKAAEFIVDRHYSREEVFSGTKSDDREDNAKSTNT